MSVTATKWCGGCKRDRPVGDFNRSSRTRDGLQTQCRECIGARRDAWTQANPDNVAAAQARYAAGHREQINAKQRRYMEALRVEVFAAYGDRCACCGEECREFLTLDHIGGRNEAHRGKTTLHVYLMVRREGFPRDRYRLLCWNCNMAHGLYGYCPHEHELREVSTCQ